LTYEPSAHDIADLAPDGRAAAARGGCIHQHVVRAGSTTDRRTSRRARAAWHTWRPWPTWRTRGFCRPADAHARHGAHATHHGAAVHADAGAAADTGGIDDASQAKAGKLSHSSCSACSAFCAGAVAPPSFSLSLPFLDGSEAVRVPSDDLLAGFIPDGLQRPPRQ